MHLVGFTMKYIVMHGPMNVKYFNSTFWALLYCSTWA